MILAILNIEDRKMVLRGGGKDFVYISCICKYCIFQRHSGSPAEGSVQEQYCRAAHGHQVPAGMHAAGPAPDVYPGGVAGDKQHPGIRDIPGGLHVAETALVFGGGDRGEHTPAGSGGLGAGGSPEAGKAYTFVHGDKAPGGQVPGPGGRKGIGDGGTDREGMRQEGPFPPGKGGRRVHALRVRGA